MDSRAKPTRRKSQPSFAGFVPTTTKPRPTVVREAERHARDPTSVAKKPVNGKEKKLAVPPALNISKKNLDEKKAQNRENSPSKDSSSSSSSLSIDSVELEEQFGDRQNRCVKICKQNWPCHRISFPKPNTRKEHVFWAALLLELLVAILGLVTVVLSLELIYIDLAWNEQVQFEGPFGLHEPDYEICFGARSWLTNNWKLNFLRPLASLNIHFCFAVTGFCSQFGHVLLVFLVKGLYGVYNECQHMIAYALSFVLYAVQIGLMKSIITNRQAHYTEVMKFMTGCTELHEKDSPGWKLMTDGSNKVYAAFQSCAKDRLSSTDANEICLDWHETIFYICMAQLTISLLLVIGIGIDIYCDWNKGKGQVRPASKVASRVHPAVDDGIFVFQESDTRLSKKSSVTR